MLVTLSLLVLKLATYQHCNSFIWQILFFLWKTQTFNDSNSHLVHLTRIIFNTEAYMILNISILDTFTCLKRLQDHTWYANGLKISKAPQIANYFKTKFICNTHSHITYKGENFSDYTNFHFSHCSYYIVVSMKIPIKSNTLRKCTSAIIYYTHKQVHTTFWNIQPYPFNNGRNCKMYNSLVQQTYTAKILKTPATAGKYNVFTHTVKHLYIFPNRTKIHNKYSVQSF